MLSWSISNSGFYLKKKNKKNKGSLLLFFSSSIGKELGLPALQIWGWRAHPCSAQAAGLRGDPGGSRKGGRGGRWNCCPVQGCSLQWTRKSGSKGWGRILTPARALSMGTRGVCTDPSACEISSIRSAAELLQVNESISTDFKDFGLDSLTSTNERYCIRASRYYLGPCCPAAHLFCCSWGTSSRPAKPTAAYLSKPHYVPHSSSFKCWNLIIHLTLMAFRSAHCIPFNMAISLLFIYFLKQNSQVEVSRFFYSPISFKKIIGSLFSLRTKLQQ